MVANVYYQQLVTTTFSVAGAKLSKLSMRQEWLGTQGCSLVDTSIQSQFQV